PRFLPLRSSLFSLPSSLFALPSSLFSRWERDHRSRLYERSTLHALRSTLHAPRPTLHAPRSTLHAPRSTLRRLGNSPMQKKLRSPFHLGASCVYDSMLIWPGPRLVETSTHGGAWR